MMGRVAAHLLEPETNDSVVRWNAMDAILPRVGGSTPVVPIFKLMAPTTLPGQVTRSSPTGRDVEEAGFPIRMAELLGGLPGAVYVSRQSALDVRGIRRAKQAIKTAFRTQLDGLGFSMVEVLSTCPTNWGMAPQEALDWAREHLVAYYPLGDTKVSEAVRALVER